MTKAPSSILDLIETFHRNRETYTAAPYNETQVRREFIDPFFAALGWDVDNTAGYAEAYKDVIHEDAIKIGGATKAPDYCFRIGGTRKFFVEAKKPSVNIKSDAHPAYQVRRYAWSAKLPLSILTDFEEFAVYDCRIKPAKTDAPGIARVKYVKYTDYAERWDEIASIFSRDAILKGSFDKFAESNKKKRGTAEVDAAFLGEIEEWRLLLARNFTLRNKSLTARELNYAVQVTIDRIIFLRMCEDRRIEPYGRLQGLVNGPKIYDRLFQLFREADQRYNSGLFHFETEKGRSEAPDDLTPDLTLDDKVIKDILKRLYYPDCPYEFSVLPADILGQVYEQFLGQVIVRSGRSVKIEPKPEVKKAGGVYYTPTYIVDYIVKHTVGKLLEGKTPTQVAKLRILDPACGSGSFLLGAYQTLLDYHVDWYRNNDPAKHAKKKTPPIYQKADNDWRLTASEKKRILVNNIHGVDIDTQAVEVTKLSLLLKVLEGETAETIGQTLRLFHERALPDLANNIKCGNSLIGPDFYENQQLSLLDEEERFRINAFDWKTEFPDVFKRKNPGFDIVIGNPPYVRMEAFKSVKEYLRAHYDCHEERTDLYSYFIERGVNLLRERGKSGMIVSNKFVRAKYGRPLRSFLSDSATVLCVTDFAGAPVFEGATVRTIVLFLARGHDIANPEPLYIPVPTLSRIHAMQCGTLSVDEHAQDKQQVLSPTALNSDKWMLLPQLHTQILQKLELDSTNLAIWIDSSALFGMKTGLNAAFIVDETARRQLIQEDTKSEHVLRPIFFGKDVRRFHTRYAGRAVIYCHPNINIDDYPAVRRYLTQYRTKLRARAGQQEWYELQQPAVALLEHLDSPRIIYPIIAPESRFTLYSSDCLINDKCFLLPTGDCALLAVLNSKLANFYFGAVCAALEGGADRYLEFRAQYVDRFPVASKLSEGTTNKRLASLAQQMLDLHKQLTAAKTPADKTAIGRQITATDSQIDQLVYKLYNLTDDEIRIVEEATA